MSDITLCVPYYRNPRMLERQALEWSGYPEALRIIVVDDGSPADRAEDVLDTACPAAIYRIGVDVPWNRAGARNLAAHVAETDWILHADIDHVLSAEDAARLVETLLDVSRWYRFRRFRVGKADETRRKDAIDPAADYGEVKPHVDSYLCTRELYWSVGGYDEDFSGSLGGSAPFLEHMAAAAHCMLLTHVSLGVHTRHSVPDASDLHLSRDRSRYERLRREKRAAGNPLPISPLRFAWSRVR